MIAFVSSHFFFIKWLDFLVSIMFAFVTISQTFKQIQLTVITLAFSGSKMTIAYNTTTSSLKIYCAIMIQVLIQLVVNNLLVASHLAPHTALYPIKDLLFEPPLIPKVLYICSVVSEYKSN